jgi:hypothetical protein
LEIKKYLLYIDGIVEIISTYADSKLVEIRELPTYSHCNINPKNKKYLDFYFNIKTDVNFIDGGISQAFEYYKDTLRYYHRDAIVIIQYRIDEHERELAHIKDNSDESANQEKNKRQIIEILTQKRREHELNLCHHNMYRYN